MKKSQIELIGYWLVLIVSAIKDPSAAIWSANGKIAGKIYKEMPPQELDELFTESDEIPF